MSRAFFLLGLLLPTILGAPSESGKPKGKMWAVLVAGSSEWYNYSQQSNICHAYQILHRHGIPDSNIIVMMYDDIANNSENPTPGVIINKPNGPDVYHGVPKDYTGPLVNAQNFINILTGNKTAMNGVGSGKVLESGPDDHVFVYFSDHGSPGTIYFPDFEPLYADTLIDALKTMHAKKMYQKFVFYLESCESGSMFDNLLPKNINIFATTAAKPDEDAWMCYCKTRMGTCLAADYGVAWMEDIDKEENHKSLLTETLMKQYHKMAKRVTRSHVSMYGESSLGKDHVKDYLGADKKQAYLQDADETPEEFKDSVPIRDAELFTLSRKIELTDNVEEKEKLQKKLEQVIKGRKEVDELFSRILRHVTSHNLDDVKDIETSRPTLSMAMMPCYRTLVDTFRHNCVKPKSTYYLGHLYKLANLCLGEYSTKAVLEAFRAECGELTMKA